MRVTVCILTSVLLSFASAESLSPAKVESKTCVNYDKPQDIHPTHYGDGKIHLVPIFSDDGKRFTGYVIVHMPKGSPFWKRGFQVGDVLTEIDGVSFIPPAPGVDSNKNFAILKSNTFKSVRIERCQKLAIKY